MDDNKDHSGDLTALAGLAALLSFFLAALELRNATVGHLYFTETGRNWIMTSGGASILVGLALIGLTTTRRLHWLVSCLMLVAGALVACVAHIAAAFDHNQTPPPPELGMQLAIEGGGLLIQTAVAIPAAICVYAFRHCKA